MAIVVTSANGSVGIQAAVEVLGAGGSALDAVEAGTRIVELNTDDHSVGVGGYPNLLGQVELDASLMEGTTRRAGAVAALRGYPNPISIARALMDHLPQHLLLVGDGAARFAEEQGFARQDPLTPFAEDAWRRKIGGQTLEGDAAQLSFQVTMPQDPEGTVGTVNFLAQDAQGRLAVAVSTSGWAFKYPGRVGDSALIGAGSYCDDRWGACACTGLGEWTIRGGLARAIILGLEFGLSLADACERALRDLQTISLPPSIETTMSLVALDRQGNHAGYSTMPDRTYVWQTPDMREHETVERVLYP